MGKTSMDTWHSKQCCDMQCFFGNWTVTLTALSVIFQKRGISTTGLKKQCLVRLSTYVNDIPVELKAVRQAYSWSSEEAKFKKEGNDGGKEGAANVKTYGLLLNNSASGPVVVNHGWERKKMQKKPHLHHTRIGLHGCSQTPCMGKGENPAHWSQQW